MYSFYMPARASVLDHCVVFADLYAALMSHGFLKLYAANVLDLFKMGLDKFVELDAGIISRTMQNYSSPGAASAIIPVLLQVQIDQRLGICISHSETAAKRIALTNDIESAETAYYVHAAARLGYVVSNPYVL